MVSLGVVSKANEELMPMPLRPAWVLAGRPSPRGTYAVESPDERQLSGVWECNAGTFRYDFDYHEMAYIIEGEATVTDADGQVHQLRPGVSVYFPKGARTVWVVGDHVRKVFFALLDEGT